MTKTCTQSAAVKSERSGLAGRIPGSVVLQGRARPGMDPSFGIEGRADSALARVGTLRAVCFDAAACTGTIAEAEPKPLALAKQDVPSAGPCAMTRSPAASTGLFPLGVSGIKSPDANAGERGGSTSTTLETGADPDPAVAVASVADLARENGPALMFRDVLTSAQIALPALLAELMHDA